MKMYVISDHKPTFGPDVTYYLQSNDLSKKNIFNVQNEKNESFDEKNSFSDLKPHTPQRNNDDWKSRSKLQLSNSEDQENDAAMNQAEIYNAVRSIF